MTVIFPGAFLAVFLCTHMLVTVIFSGTFLAVFLCTHMLVTDFPGAFGDP